MKFFLAAGILAQTLPTLSEKVPSWDVRSTSNGKLQVTGQANVARRQTTRQYVGKRQLSARRSLALPSGGTLRNAPRGMNNHVQCDCTSIDPDTGLLSCTNGHVCQPSSSFHLNGLNSDSTFDDNEHEQETKTHALIECDPDIGVLACGVGKFCQQDEAFALGGFCELLEDNPSRRRLYDLEFAVMYYCDRPPKEGYGVCDCSGLNMTSGSGTIYCLHENITVGYGCDDLIFSKTYWFYLSDSKFTKMNGCYEIDEPYYQKVCATRLGEYLNDSCSFSFNGQECNSCSYLPDFFQFDCTNVEGGTNGSTLAETSSIVMECFVPPTYNCTNICGQGFHIPDYNSNINVTVPSFGVVSCGQLLYYDENMKIPDTQCALAMSVAQKECCTANANVPSNKPTTPPTEPTDAPSTPGGDTGSAGSLHFAKYAISQIGLVGSLIILLFKGT